MKKPTTQAQMTDRLHSTKKSPFTIRSKGQALVILTQKNSSASSIIWRVHDATLCLSTINAQVKPNSHNKTVAINIDNS